MPEFKFECYHKLQIEKARFTVKLREEKFWKYLFAFISRGLTISSGFQDTKDMIR
jgi:hypothetical protein